MLARKLSLTVILLASVASLSACGNTIRGVGEDTANAVNATQAAGQDIESAATY
ncbi:entericidin [Peteryoungia desertarenae]|uniref:Entericidin n=1 Tax=Peteryoungia desertarenae TaxID=1813451 RepID=A0ABX6QQC3_9HYPH|nr:entericidin [Peteryoungia desertarenae]QLF70501.1 entericidin [Peteryoungia desertarenae]